MTPRGRDGTDRTDGTDVPVVVVRRAVPADAPAVRACQVASWREAYGGMVAPGFFDRYDGEDGRDDGGVARWRAVLEQGHLAAVAEVGHEVVGLASTRPGSADDAAGPPPRDLELAALYVRAAYHGHGVGDRLLAATVGDRPASLWVFEANGRARAFYARHGFSPDGSRAVDSWTGLPEIRMVR